MKAVAAGMAAALLVSCATGEAVAPVESRAEPAGVTMGTWRAVDAATGRLSDLAALEQLAAQFLDSGTVQVRYLNALIQAGEAPKAYALVDRISARGYRFSAAGERQLNAFFAENGYPKPLELAVRPGDIREASTLLAGVPAEVPLVESVLRDRSTGRLYVSSVVGRGLYRQDGRGSWERVSLGDTGSLGGMQHAADGTIWVSSARYDPTPDPDTAFAGVIGYDPRTGAVRRIAAPPDATPSDIAIGRDGTIFAADPLTGAVYRARAGDERLETFIAPGTFRSAQGMAVSPDGSFLYLSDYGYGLALVDLSTGRVDRLPAPNSLFVDGTDGLWLHDGQLIAIQNGARPPRIVAHRLAPDGRSIRDTRVLESAHPGWTEPGAGSIGGDRLLYVATGQWDRFGKGGAPVEGKPALPTDLRTLELREAPALPPKKQP